MIAKYTTFTTKHTRFVTAEKFHDKLRFVKNKERNSLTAREQILLRKTRRMYEREKAENEQ